MLSQVRCSKCGGEQSIEDDGLYCLNPDCDRFVRELEGIVNELNDDVGCGPFKLLVGGRDQVQGVDIDELLKGLDGKRVRVIVQVIEP